MNIILFLARNFGSSARLLSFPTPEACWCTSRIRERQVTKQLTKITAKMQNKPNLRDAQMNVSAVRTKEYENVPLRRRAENKPNQTQFSNLFPISLKNRYLQNTCAVIQFEDPNVPYRYTPAHRNRRGCPHPPDTAGRGESRDQPRRVPRREEVQDVLSSGKRREWPR